jgi:hypothetical protein
MNGLIRDPLSCLKEIPLIVTRGESRRAVCAINDIGKSSVGVRIVTNDPLVQILEEVQLAWVMESDLSKDKLLFLNKEARELPSGG